MESIDHEPEGYCFHCGRCGSLFVDQLQATEGRVCPACGMDPAPDLESGVPVLSAVRKIESLALPESKAHRARHGMGRLARLRALLLWVLLLAGMFFLGRWLMDHKTKPVEAVKKPVPESGGGARQEDELLQIALPECRSTLAAFLATEVTDERLALVMDAERVGPLMKEYYRNNPTVPMDAEELMLKASTALDLPEGKCVLTQWETIHGHQFDAAFRLAGASWKLDWDHFVRYSEVDWALFFAGSGPEEAEFRLLARERTDGADDDENAFGIVLYAPQQNRVADAGFKAQMLPMRRESRDARLLQLAFKRMREGIPMFGASFQDINPQDMIRVRVRVRRHSGPGRYNFEITRVAACHWYASSSWGISPADLEAAGDKPDAGIVPVKER